MCFPSIWEENYRRGSLYWLVNWLLGCLNQTRMAVKDSCSCTLSAIRVGWRSYGAILDNLQGGQDLLEKIKGCVVDSGGDPEINPKVWAAAFVAALLEKHSSATYTSVEMGEGNELETTKQKEPPLIETLLLVAFEKLFSYLLHLPDINRRLKRIIATLWKQSPYPQLYLYSIVRPQVGLLINKEG